MKKDRGCVGRNTWCWDYTHSGMDNVQYVSLANQTLATQDL
jgi:hypothetical protein